MYIVPATSDEKTIGILTIPFKFLVKLDDIDKKNKGTREFVIKHFLACFIRSLKVFSSITSNPCIPTIVLLNIFIAGISVILEYMFDLTSVPTVFSRSLFMALFCHLLISLSSILYNVPILFSSGRVNFLSFLFLSRWEYLIP